MKIKISSPLQLSTHFKSLRRAKGWSQSDLARRLGITQSRIAQIESRPGLISVDKLIQILHALDVRLLLDQESDKIKNSSPLKALAKVASVPSKKSNIPYGQSRVPKKVVLGSPTPSRKNPKSTATYRSSSTGRFVLKSNAPKDSKNTKW